MDQMTDVERALAHPRQAAITRVEERKIRPVVGWAWVGAAFLVFAVFLMARWMLSGEFTQTHPGPTPVPGYMKVTIVALIVVGMCLAAFFLYYFVLRPWRRERRLTVDALVLFAMTLLFWQDSLAVAFSVPYSFNAWTPNAGNWIAGVPGATNPTASKLAEPFLLFTVGLYLYFCFLYVLMGSAMMRRWKSRKPEISNFELIVRVFSFLFVFDIIVESIFLRGGYYVYLWGFKGWTLFSSHYYQLPVHEVLLVSLVFTLLTCLRYFTNDKGQTIAERGIDSVRLSQKRKTVVRFLAIYGVANVMYFSYTIPTVVLANHSKAMPADTLKRSYFLDKMCGQGTDYACPGPGVPIPRINSAHLNPDGQMVPGKDQYPGNVPFVTK